MARNLFLLVAILAAVVSPEWAPAQTLDAAPYFEWDHWALKIGELKFTDFVTRFREKKRADDNSIFLYMNLAVVNIGHQGRSFIPQNTLKIIIGDNAFDAVDLDGMGLTYLSNIEPMLGQLRACYFELPRRLIRGSFINSFFSIFRRDKGY